MEKSIPILKENVERSYIGKAPSSHGGKREGSGRKKKPPTKTIRVPISKLKEIEQVISGNVPVKMKTK